ncbi:MAG: hypothetical protein Q9221_001279 [Calogaya cf. arnoldii]
MITTRGERISIPDHQFTDEDFKMKNQVRKGAHVSFLNKDYVEFTEIPEFRDANCIELKCSFDKDNGSTGLPVISDAEGFNPLEVVLANKILDEVKAQRAEMAKDMET